MPQLSNPMMMNQQMQYPTVKTASLNQNKGLGTKIYQGIFGAPDELQQTAIYSPEQQQTMQQLLSMGLGGLKQTPFSFEPIANQARQNFSQKTIPSIAERFTALGGQRSSAFNQALGSAGAGLETDLASLGSQYNLAQQGNLLKLLLTGLQPQYENSFRQGSGGLLGSLGQGAGFGASIGLRGLLGL